MKAQSISPTKVGERPEKLAKSINLGARRMTYLGPMTALVKPINKLGGLLWSKEEPKSQTPVPLISLYLRASENESKGKGYSMQDQ
jgi:hypothetical protein